MKKQYKQELGGGKLARWARLRSIAQTKVFSGIMSIADYAYEVTRVAAQDVGGPDPQKGESEGGIESGQRFQPVVELGAEPENAVKFNVKGKDEAVQKAGRRIRAQIEDVEARRCIHVGMPTNLSIDKECASEAAARAELALNAFLPLRGRKSSKR